MSIVVKKFGGTSVGNIERIKRVAKIVANSQEKVIVVVSAMAGVTNQLVDYASSIYTISTAKEISEYDAVISSGEQITTGLMSLALMSLGINSRSYLGWQVPIITNSDHSKAKILHIESDKLLQDLEKNIVPVIAGFQGVYNDRITTLGRGGSDTSAVAIAAAVKAVRCDIYTDVNGIFTADPKIVPKARKIEKMDYESTVEMASCGAKVIHPRAVEIAMNYHIPIRILNTFSDDSGTTIAKRKNMEKAIINGIAVKRNLSMITITINIKEIDQFLSQIVNSSIMIESATQFNISFEKIGSQETVCDYTIVVENEYLDRILKICENLKKQAIVRNNIHKISIVGVGIKNENDILQRVLNSVQSTDATIIAMNFLETQIAFLVNEIYTDRIVRLLHTNLGLDI